MSKLIAVIGAAGIIAAAWGCKKEEKGSGLPPAEEWNAPTEPGAPTGGASGANPHGGMAGPHGGMANPRGGMADPHGGMADPHGGAGAMGAPHGAGSGDPSKFVEGTIVISEAMREHVEPGSALYLNVRRYDPATKGPAAEAPVAVDKMDQIVLPATFHLQVGLDGKAVVTAHISQTGSAGERVSGDIVGVAEVEVPAKGVKLELDTIVD